MQNWTVRFKSEFDRFFGKGNWEYISADIERSTVYTTYHSNRSNPMLSGQKSGPFADWYISFTNRFTAKQVLTRELMEISFEMVGEEVVNEIILDVLTEEEASCMEITMSYDGGNPKPDVYGALRKEPWFKANEITAADYLATDIYDFHLYIRVHDYRMEKLTEEQQN